MKNENARNPISTLSQNLRILFEYAMFELDLSGEQIIEICRGQIVSIEVERVYEKHKK